MKIDPKSRFHWENMWECKLMWLDETWNVITQQGIQHIRGNVKIIVFPEIIVFKNKWLLNSSKNIIKELVSRKGYCCLSDCRLSPWWLFTNVLFYSSDHVGGKGKKNGEVFRFVWIPLLLNFAQGNFLVVWRVNSMLICHWFCLLAICFHPKPLMLGKTKTKTNQNKRQVVWN